MSNNRKYLTRDEVRDYDRRAIEELGVPGVVLMENAGRGAAELLLSLLPHKENRAVVICCGRGNNGGDGFVIARHLHLAGIAVQVLLFAPLSELTGDAAINGRIIANLRIPLSFVTQPSCQKLLDALAHGDWIVDALFGTGLKGAVRPPFDVIIRAINAAGKKVFAVDIPSGLDCDTGEPLGEAIRADVTATFVALKQGYANPQSVQWTGPVHVIGIGV